MQPRAESKMEEKRENELSYWQLVNQAAARLGCCYYSKPMSPGHTPIPIVVKEERSPPVGGKRSVQQAVCFYCNKPIEHFNFKLTPEEAKKVPYLCPRHFQMDNLARNFSPLPQDPEQICQDCTIVFRMSVTFCSFGGQNPGHHDPSCLRCRKSTEGASGVSVYSRKSEVEAEFPARVQYGRAPEICPTHPLSWKSRN